MADRDASEVVPPPAGLVRSAWVELVGGAVVATMLAGFLAIVFTSMHW